MRWIRPRQLNFSQNLSRYSTTVFWTQLGRAGLVAIAGLSATAIPVWTESAIADSAQTKEEYIWPHDAEVCPEAVEPLTAMLLRDLPSYTNRVLLRAYGRSPGDLEDEIRLDPERTTYLDIRQPGIVIIAGIPEFAPLTLGPGIYRPVEPTEEAEPEAGAPEQVFFTTLERQYLREGDTEEIQQFHWLFLARTDERWYLSQLFSSWGGYPNGFPPTAPENATNGAIAQAIRLWLDDCAAGSVAPL